MGEIENNILKKYKTLDLKELLILSNRLNDFYVTEEIHKLIEIKNKKIDLNLEKSKLDRKMIDIYLQELNDNGTVIIPDYFNKEEIAGILKHINNFCFVNKMNNKKYEVNKNNKGVFWCDNLKLADNQFIKNLMSDKGIIHIIQEYLNCEPKLATVISWKSFKTDSQDEQNKNAQMFHQDCTYIKFLKIFIYLNDVTVENGCHRFINNSFKNKPQIKNHKGGQRICDEKIKKIFGEDCIRNLEGKKGTIIIENTRNFHSGSPCIEGHREIFQLFYTSDFCK
jgi:ectoine hydroxylase-related dioxygenase (phytanoyl-CoA dioxygenase family)